MSIISFERTLTHWSGRRSSKRRILISEECRTPVHVEVTWENSLQNCYKCYGRGGCRAGLAVQGATKTHRTLLPLQGRTRLRQTEPVVVPGLPADGSTRSEIGEPKGLISEDWYHYMD